MLSCKDITEQANSYLEKELPFTKRLGVRLHLFMCLHCRHYIEQLQTTIQTLSRMKKDEPVDDAYHKHLVDCFKKDLQSDQKRSD
ncbi:MAG: hypothetical protein AMJ53_18200 [Gammaproteobacteria bacterium SG8_11]|nr:MAG: hypothetical protein AMJ53_18200 [Gammaproteobacteria bacterium SG8_11]